MLTSLGGSPYLLLARVGRLLMCMVVAVCDGNEGLAAIKNNPDIAMVITDMRYRCWRRWAAGMLTDEYDR